MKESQNMVLDLKYSICVNLRLSSERSERAVTRDETADERR